MSLQPQQRLPRAIVLIGPRAVGKSTVGRALAEQLGFAFCDTDELLAAAAGVSAGAHLALAGEVLFRRLEATVTLQALVKARQTVLALGGGAVTIPEVLSALLQPSLFVVFLFAPVAVLVQRLQQSPDLRPPLTSMPQEAEVAALLSQRLMLYERAAHLRLNAASLPVSELARQIALRCASFCD
jgi:shikimate kinase